jgi:hypothetical protein
MLSPLLARPALLTVPYALTPSLVSPVPLLSSTLAMIAALLLVRNTITAGWLGVWPASYPA